jgi:ABC-2 type transport system ATP-binding protein
MVDGMHPPALCVRDASYSYGNRTALRNVDLTVNAGEIYTLLGPNGAGKTTLVRAISSRIAPSRGAIEVAGHAVARDRAHRGLLGIVPQQIALYPHLTARENLITFARLMKVGPRQSQQRTDDFLLRAGLAGRASSLVSTLSGGMQRRINIGAALMHRPKLVVLDEPTVGIDLHARESIHELLNDLREEGYAILLMTHDMDQAAALSDRVGIIHAGRIVAEDAPRRLIEDYFGKHSELVIALVHPPDRHQRDQLAEVGLKPVRGDLLWSGAAPESYEATAPQLKRLNDAGVEIRSVNIQQPTLGSVFFHVVGQELGD